MLRGVAGGSQGPQPQPAEVSLVAVVAVPWWPNPLPPCGGGEHLRAVRGELAAAGHEIGVQVGLGRKAPILSPRDSAAARYGPGSRSGSIASARPSPRSTR